MEAVRLIAAVLNALLFLYVIVLLARLVLEYIPMFNREWRPTGGGLIAAEVVFTVTDPPIKFFRRFVRPLRIGGMAIDFAFALTMMLVFMLMAVTRALAS